MDTPENVKPAHCGHKVVGRLVVQTCTADGRLDQTRTFDVRHGVESKGDAEGMEFEVDGSHCFHISHRFYHSHEVYPVVGPDEMIEALAPQDEVSGD